jgi:hypothetical protein
MFVKTGQPDPDFLTSQSSTALFFCQAGLEWK